MFARIFSEDWLRSNPLSDEPVFIDRDGKMFQYVLQYLRDGDKMILPSGVEKLLCLKNESEIYLLDGLSEMIDLKLNRNDKQIVCGSKVRFREDSLELYVPVMRSAYMLSIYNVRSSPLIKCQHCHESLYHKEQTVLDEYIKGYMRINCFVVQEVTDSCCFIATENGPSNKIHVRKCALEF